jgi:hypothetical protein
MTSHIPEKPYAWNDLVLLLPQMGDDLAYMQKSPLNPHEHGKNGQMDKAARMAGRQNALSISHRRPASFPKMALSWLAFASQASI